MRICPPFPGYSRDQLIEAISNPFRPPSRPGSDDPHQAIDLAVTLNGLSMQGDPVHLVLDGRVAAVVADRFPYGNALLVETPLEGLPMELLARLLVPISKPKLLPPRLLAPLNCRPCFRYKPYMATVPQGQHLPLVPHLPSCRQ